MRMRLPKLTYAFLPTLVGARVLEERRTSTTNTIPNQTQPQKKLELLTYQRNTCPGAKGSDYPHISSGSHCYMD